MEDKYWALILIVGIIIAFGIGYNLGQIKRYNLVDQMHDNLSECMLKWEECESNPFPVCEDCKLKIDYCFEKCRYGYPVVGWENQYRVCLWDCFHPNYGIVKIAEEK